MVGGWKEEECKFKVTIYFRAFRSGLALGWSPETKEGVCENEPYTLHAKYPSALPYSVLEFLDESQHHAIHEPTIIHKYRSTTRVSLFFGFHLHTLLKNNI